jgi:hypothetical protein
MKVFVIIGGCPHPPKQNVRKDNGICYIEKQKLTGCWMEMKSPLLALLKAVC